VERARRRSVRRHVLRGRQRDRLRRIADEWPRGNQVRTEGIFGSHQTASYVAKVRKSGASASDVLLARSVVGMVPPGKAELSPAVNAIQSVVAAGRGADMRIALLHNTPAAFHGRPELAEQLTRELTDALRSGRTVTA
jgi:hypothetical protein